MNLPGTLLMDAPTHKSWRLCTTCYGYELVKLFFYSVSLHTDVFDNDVIDDVVELAES